MKQLIRKTELRVSNWGGGSSTELFIYPPTASYPKRDFEVRISSATINESPSDFTVLTGYNRLLMPLTSTITLQIGESKPATIMPFEKVFFDGGLRTVSNGICTDVGIMYKSGYDCNIIPVFGRYAYNATIKDNEDCPILADSYGFGNLFNCVFALCDGVSVSTDDDIYSMDSGDLLILESKTAKYSITISSTDCLDGLINQDIRATKNTAIIFAISKNMGTK